MPSPKLTFSTGSLYLYSLDRCFALAAELGFDGLEVMCDERYDTRQPDNLRRLMAQFDMPITSLHVPLKAARLGGWQPGARAAVEQTVKLAEAVGAEHVVMHLPQRLWYATLSYGARSWMLPARSVHGELRRWMESGGLAQFQADTPVKICVENLPLLTHALKDRWLTCWNSLAEWPQVHDHLTLDTTHWATHGIDPLAAYIAAKGRVRHIHLSNYQDGQQHLPPQQGALDLEHFLRRLSADGFTGHVVVELNPFTLEAWEEIYARRHLEGAVTFCREALGESIYAAVPELEYL